MHRYSIFILYADCRAAIPAQQPYLQCSKYVQKEKLWGTGNFEFRVVKPNLPNILNHIQPILWPLKILEIFRPLRTFRSLYFNFHWYESRKVWFVISRKYVPNKGNQNGSVSHYLVHLLWNNFPKRKEIILECFCRIILLPSLNEIIQCFCKRLIFQKVFGFFLEKLKVTNNIFVFFYMVVSKTR